MTDWDLLTPGIGLTSIGITGVGISLSGIAKTFIDGMHAVSLLTMFIGMIFLASGLFKDGFPTSGRAKSATFLTLGFLVTFGVAAAVTVSTQVPSIFAYIGLMTIIGIPASVLAFIAYRKPQYVKAMGAIFIGGAIVAGITFYAFGLVAPKPPAEEEPAAEGGAGGGGGQNATSGGEGPAAAPANIVKAEILAGASSQDNPDYAPDPVVVTKGDGVEWTNNDNAPHTVTHNVQENPLFDSSIISAGKTYLLDTSTLEEGEYEYYCTLHPFMRAALQVVGGAAAGGAPASGGQAAEGNSTTAAAAEGEANATEGGAAATATTTAGTSGSENAPEDLVTAVSIPVGASAPTNGEFFSPAEVETVVGGMVTWTNNDTALHTATSGDAKAVKPDGVFDSGFLKKGQSYSFVFEKAGEYDYYCQLHPFMTGKVVVS